MSNEPATSNEAPDSDNAKPAAAGLAVVLLILMPLQVFSLLRLKQALGDRELMESLSWNEALGVCQDLTFHELHLVGSVLGLCAMCLLYISRGTGERRALFLAGLPVALSTASWVVWAVTHYDNVVGHYGVGIVIGGIGVLSGLVCPLAAIFVLAQGWQEARARSRPFSVMLYLGILVWTIVTVARTIPYVAAA